MAVLESLDTTTFLACIFTLISIVLAFSFFIRAYLKDSSHAATLGQLNIKMAVLKATSSSAESMLNLQSFEDFLRVYSKPMLYSLTDLQNMLSVQVRKNFLYQAAQTTQKIRNPQAFIFLHCVAEFLAWLEIYRLYVQSLPVSAPEMDDIIALIEDIKKQFEGHTELQGRRAEGARPSEYDEHSQVLQLHFGEMQAIGAVMLVTTNDAATQLSVRSPMSIDEFLRAVTVTPPPSDAPYSLQYAWNQSLEHKVQVVLSPLLDEIDAMSELDDASAPKHRLALLQVLVCKLIDMLDPAVPWDLGPEYDPGEQRPVVNRNERLTPLVAYLSHAQRTWLSQRPYFKYSDPNISFPGFRADLRTRSQEERDSHPDLWPGACPDKEPRRRPPRWRKDNPHSSQRPHSTE